MDSLTKCEFCILPIVGCATLSMMYVLSLYIWENNHLRNDPSVIKKRFVSVLCTSILSPFFIYIFSTSEAIKKHSIFDLLGLRVPGLFMALTVPLILTMVLFLGPLAMQSQTDSWPLYCESPEKKVQLAKMPVTSSNHISPPSTVVHGVDDKSGTVKHPCSVHNVPFKISSGSSVEENLPVNIETTMSPPQNGSGFDEQLSSDGSCKIVENDNKTTVPVKYSEPLYWLDSCKDLEWIRDHIVAPFSEELTFRACMLPLLVQCFRPQSAIFICPLFFGLAHFHHVIGRVKSGWKLKTAILLAGFQFMFTTMFGAYSAFLFLRTGHFIAPVLAHAFCNHIGFPNFREIWTYKEPNRSITFALCVVGLVAWCFLLSPLTNPSWYSNTIYWKV